MDWETIGASVRRTNALLVVEQTTRSTSIGSRVVSRAQSRLFDGNGPRDCPCQRHRVLARGVEGAGARGAGRRRCRGDGAARHRCAARRIGPGPERGQGLRMPVSRQQALRTAVSVGDFERAKRFYLDFLGFELEGEMDQRSGSASARWSACRAPPSAGPCYATDSTAWSCSSTTPQGDMQPRRQCDLGYNRPAPSRWVTWMPSTSRPCRPATSACRSPRSCARGAPRCSTLAEPEGAITEFISSCSLRVELSPGLAGRARPRPSGPSTRIQYAKHHRHGRSSHGEAIDAARLVAWIVQPGEAFEAGRILVE